MLLKRIYNRDAEGRATGVSCVRVLRAGRFQKITPKFVEAQAAAGILSIGQGRIVILTEAGQPDLVFKIQRPPGLYCCHCQAQLGDSKEAASHVAAGHENRASPDPCNPAGYRKDNFYFCEREESQ